MAEALGRELKINELSDNEVGCPLYKYIHLKINELYSRRK
jgi:hypothetical protein